MNGDVHFLDAAVCSLSGSQASMAVILSFERDVFSCGTFTLTCLGPQDP